jgi:4-hydroxy-tetrahydrodipicolinate synthase
MTAPSTDAPNAPATRRFQGAFTALATPFRDGAVSYADLKNLVDFQLAQGIDGLVSVGTTGESPTLDTDEHIEVIAKTVEFAAGRAPVLAGTGSNATDEAVLLTRRADAAGADAFLVVAPYYNKPSPEGIYRHFAAIAAATAKPILLYSIQGRCGVEISVATTARLRANHPNIVGIKEAGGSCEKVSQLVRTLDPDFAVLCGDDALTLPFLSLGARGVVSVASNWLPAPVARLVKLALAGDRARALALHNQLAAVFKTIFIESNPVPIKHLLFRAGLFASPEVRLPLSELSADNLATVDALFEANKNLR